MSVQPWKRVEPTIATKVDYRHLIIKTFQVPGTDRLLTIATYNNEGARSAAVIAVTKDHKVVIARQFRHGPEKIMDEIPGGGVELAEEPEVAARRELLEETGYVPGKMESLGKCWRDAYTNMEAYYYLATDCTLDPAGAKNDEDEQVEVCLIPIAEFLENAKRDTMTDQGAVLMAYDKLMKLTQQD